MNYEPTEAEFRGLLRVLGEFPLSWKLTDQIARRILRHYEPRTREQRCDGSGVLAYWHEHQISGASFRGRCPGCVNCQDRDGGLTRKGDSTTESDARTAQAAAPVAPITIALDARSLRAIYSVVDALLELQYGPAIRTSRPATRDDFPGFDEIDKEAQK